MPEPLFGWGFSIRSSGAWASNRLGFHRLLVGVFEFIYCWCFIWIFTRSGFGSGSISSEWNFQGPIRFGVIISGINPDQIISVRFEWGRGFRPARNGPNGKWAIWQWAKWPKPIRWSCEPVFPPVFFYQFSLVFSTIFSITFHLFFNHIPNLKEFHLGT